jgi:hypothetical protein
VKQFTPSAGLLQFIAPTLNLVLGVLVCVENRTRRADRFPARLARNHGFLDRYAPIRAQGRR